MTRAVREARNRLVAAKGKVRRAGIADRPAAVALRQLEKRAALRAVDRLGGKHCAVGVTRHVGVDEPQKRPLRRDPRAPGAGRARPPRRSRGPPRRKAKAVDFADDGVTGDADFGGDLTACEPCHDAVSELFDALRSPGCKSSCVGPFDAAACSEPPTGRRPRAKPAPARAAQPQKREFGARRRARRRDHRAASALVGCGPAF